MCKLLALSLLIALSAQILPHRSIATMQVKKLKVNNVELSYVEEGSGDTVILVHGFTGDWRSGDPLRPFISEKYHYVSLSRRYHYPNARISDGQNYTTTQHGEDLAAFIRALNVGKVHLVGNSGGGRIVCYVALKYPELVRSVVMGEASIIASDSAEGKAAQTAAQENSAKVLAAMKAGDATRAMRLHYDAIAGEHGAWEKLPRERRRQRLDNASTVIPTLTGSGAIPVTCEELGALTVPALVVGGEKSPADFRYRNEALLRCLPKTTAAAVIPGAHHEWYAVNPEASAKAILTFLAAPAVKKMALDGTAVMYLEQGTGTPVVFVHGWFSDHRIWETQRDAVAKRHRFIAVDQRYFGTSPWPDTGAEFSPTTHVADLAAFIRRLESGPVYLVGQSYGSTISLATAIRHPELVRGLFLNEPQAPSLLTDRLDQRRADEDRKGVAAARAASAAGRNDEATKLFFDFASNQTGAFDALPPEARAMRLDNSRTAPRALNAPPVSITCKQAGQLKIPVILTKGELTRTFYRVITEAVSRCIAGAQLITIKGATHGAPSQQPAAFNDALLAFLGRYRQ